MNYKKKASSLCKKLSFNEKLRMTTGKGCFELYLPDILKNNKPIKLADGPIGLRKVVGDETISSISLPCGSALASSFDKSLAYKYGEIFSKEIKEKDIDVILGPAMNIKRNPLCGRNFEYYSEDPILSSKIAANYINGLEDNNVSACPKHFILNNIEYARKRMSSNVDDKAFNEIYLRNFEIMFKESKPSFLMTSYNRYNGLHTNENKDLLYKVRNEFGFNGIIISDWDATKSKENMIKASNDIEMPESDLYKFISDKDKDLNKELDKSVTRILEYTLSHNKKLKVKNNDINIREEAAKICANSNILLKNDNILPLKLNESILVVGDYANNPNFNGEGSSRVQTSNIVKFTDELDKLNINYSYSVGYSEKRDINDELINDAVSQASLYDKVILFVGDNRYSESEEVDRKDLLMNDCMYNLIEKLSNINPNLIVIIESGAPVEIKNTDIIKGLIVSYFGGEMMNKGLIYNLYGFISPSGRLCESWPKKLSNVPSLIFTDDPLNVYYSESIYVGYRFYDQVDNYTDYSFGYGLSYSSFSIKSLKYAKNKKGISFKVKCKNIGSYDSSISIPLYFSKEKTNTFRPKKELIDFDKHFIKVNETKTFNFFVPYDYLTTFDITRGKMVLESGIYKFMVGLNPNELNKSVSIIINGLTINNIKDEYSNYFNIKSNFFPVSDYYKLLNKKIPSDVLINRDSLLRELTINETAKSVKSLFDSYIKEYSLNNPKLSNYIKFITPQIGLRTLCEFLHIMSNEDLYKMIDIINGNHLPLIKDFKEIYEYSFDK